MMSWAVGGMMFFCGQEWPNLLVFQHDQGGFTAVDPTYNVTVWEYESAYTAFGMLVDEALGTFTVGGMMNNRVTRFDAFTGFQVWSLILNFTDSDPYMMEVDDSHRTWVDLHGDQLLLIDSVTGTMLAQKSAGDIPVLGDIQAETFVPAGGDTPAGALYLGGSGQLTRVDLIDDKSAGTR
jgi:hypothetical protein